jgi:two-component system chemotaxis response regulator CheY
LGANDAQSVLVVDDDPDIRRLLRTYLMKMNFDVSEAGSGKAAWAQLELLQPRLVCLDLMLPESSGFEICERIRATPRLRGLPVLVISARSMPHDRALAEEAGASAYLMKPLRRQSFVEAVRALTGPSAS